METKKQEFAEDIKSLLGNYFDQVEIDTFTSKMKTRKEKDGPNELINKFYTQQLNIDNDFAKDRMEIDRAITLAMKKLSKEKFLSFLCKLGQICTGHGKLNLAFEVLSKAVKESENKKDKADSLLLLSDVHSRRAEWKKSIEVLNTAKDLFNSIHDDNGVGKCENILGAIYGEKGELELAKIHFEKCLALIDPIKEKELAALVELNLGNIGNIHGEYDKSHEYFIKSLRKFESLGNYRRIAELKHSMGMLFVNQEKYNEAIYEFDQSIEISIKEGLLPILTIAYLNKANVLIKLKEFDSALCFVDKSLEFSHQIDDKLTIADIYKTKSNIEKHFKNYDKAENYLQSSLLLNEKMNNHLNIAESCFELAQLYDELNRKEEKEKYLQRSLKYFRGIQAAGYIQKVEEMLAMSI